MLNWNTVNKVYLYDGSFDGLLTIVFDCFVNKTIPLNVHPINNYKINLLEETVEIKTDFEKSQRIFNGVVKNISYKTLYNSYHAFLANDDSKEINILKYLLDGFIVGQKINTMLSVDYVLNVYLLRKKMLSESHGFKGLVRFIDIGNNVFYSSIHPTHNVLEDLGHHFVNRLPNQNFIIHDKNRNIAFFYNTKEYKIINDFSFDIADLSQEEKDYQNLWKAFFKTISIKERKNPKVQMEFMPKKYWKDLIEMKF